MSSKVGLKEALEERAFIRSSTINRNCSRTWVCKSRCLNSWRIRGLLISKQTRAQTSMTPKSTNLKKQISLSTETSLWSIIRSTGQCKTPPLWRCTTKKITNLLKIWRTAKKWNKTNTLLKASLEARDLCWICKTRKSFRNNSCFNSWIQSLRPKRLWILSQTLWPKNSKYRNWKR